MINFNDTDTNLIVKGTSTVTIQPTKFSLLIRISVKLTSLITRGQK
jgi:hypothetical protein